MKRVSLYAALLVCVLCMAVHPVSAIAEETDQDEAVSFYMIYDYAVVEGNEKVNMRIGPSANYDWVSAASPGDWVGILGEQGNWYYAYIPQYNQYGYMSKYYLTVRDGTVTPAAGVIDNPQTGEKTCLRSFPGFQASVLKQCENGMACTLVSLSDNGWYEAEMEGIRGFLRCETVRLQDVPDAEIATLQAPDGGIVQMRDRPSYLGAQIIGQFSSGTQAAVLLKSPAEETFWKVIANGKVGFVPARFVKMDGDWEDKYAENEETGVIPQSVTLRSQPSANARAIGRCSGTALRVVVPGETWSKVYDSENHRLGYCRTKYLSLSQYPALTIQTVQSDDAFLYLNLEGENAGKSGFTLPKGVEVTVLIPGDVWTQVRFTGTVGYMKTETLQ